MSREMGGAENVQCVMPQQDRSTLQLHVKIVIVCGCERALPGLVALEALRAARKVVGIARRTGPVTCSRQRRPSASNNVCSMLTKVVELNP